MTIGADSPAPNAGGLGMIAAMPGLEKRCRIELKACYSNGVNREAKP
jgi:hypothetical protein